MSRMIGQRTRGDEYNEIESRKIELEEQLLDLQERRLDIEQKRIELELRKLKLVKGKSKRRYKRSSSQAPREESGDEAEDGDPRRLVSSVDSDDDDDYDYKSQPRRSRSYDTASNDGVTTDDDYVSHDDDDPYDEDPTSNDVQQSRTSKRLPRSVSSTSDPGDSTNLPPTGRNKPVRSNSSSREIAEASSLPPLMTKAKPARQPNSPATHKEPDVSPHARSRSDIPPPQTPRRRRSGRRGSAPANPVAPVDEMDRRLSMSRFNSVKCDGFVESRFSHKNDSERSLGSQDTEKRSNTRIDR